MNYLDALQSELKTAGIPARRRRRILTEFEDHLREDPGAELGVPRELARQFADELGTRLARRTATAAFLALALTAAFLAAMFVTGGRQHGWVGYAGHRSSLGAVWWWGPVQVVCVVAAQVALASGLLAAIRAYRLRRERAITGADAAIINRRTAVALFAGALTMVVLPLTREATYLGVPHSGLWWGAARYGGIAAMVVLLGLLPSVFMASRLSPHREGPAGDLTVDLGTQGLPVTPWHAAVVLSLGIVIALALLGAVNDDPYDGLARGLADGLACMAGFALLGGYLGLRTSGSMRHQ